MQLAATRRMRSGARRLRRDAESARRMYDAGVDLIELYTGFIYRGPGLIAEIAES